LSDACRLDAFRCGEPLIDDWARRHALDRHNRFKARVVTCHDGETGALVGLYSLTLVLEQVREMKRAHDVTRWATNGVFPALQLEYLGVCERHKRLGIGSFLTMDAVTTFSRLAETTGVPVLTLQPLNADLVPYYRDRNFLPYGRGGGMMMLAETAIRLRDGTFDAPPNG